MSASKTDYSQLIPAAIRDSFLKLDPREQVKNPVMLVVFLGAIWTTVTLFTSFSGFNLQIAIWLWFTVLFANFAEAMAEGRGKAQANALRQARTQTMARRLRNGVEERVASTELRKGDLVVCEANDPIPADGEVVEGVASVDEAAITGESAPSFAKAAATIALSRAEPACSATASSSVSAPIRERDSLIA